MKAIVVFFLLFILIGCAGKDVMKDEWRTRIDPMGATRVEFEAHHDQCADLAYTDLEQVRNKRFAGIAIGAVAGAAVGLATAVILGRGAGSKIGQKVMGLGALYGAGAGAMSPQDHAYQIYGNCMKNRGYQILW